MPQLLPVSAHLLDPDLTGVHLDLDFFDMLHDDLAIVHLKEYGLHLEVLELPLHQHVDHADVPGGPEYSQLSSLIHRVHIIAHEITAEVEIDRVKFPIMRQIFFLVTHELADEIPRD